MRNFDKNRYLNKKYIYFSIIIFMILGISLIVVDKNSVKQKFANSISNESLIGTYIDGEYSENIPGKNDGYVVEKIVCDNDAVAEWDSETWGILVKNMTKKSKCNVYFETKKLTVNETISNAMSSSSSMFASDDADSNVRYIGANPDNYVYFNCSDYNNQSDSTCEKWRIIGVFNSVTKSDGTKENLVKIIRDESIGNYTWDDNGTNDWSTATLQTYLNSGTYYTTTLKNDTTRNVIEEVVWNLGSTDAYDTSNASMFYTAERGTTVYSGRPTTWTGKIGLMYPSDYGYATAGGSTTNRAICLAKELFNWDSSSVSDCKDNDYLYKSSFIQWTLAPFSGYAYNAFNVRSVGCINYYSTRNAYGVLPTLFLKSNIKIKAGTGSSDNPYQFSL